MNRTRRSIMGMGAAWVLGGCATSGAGPQAYRPERKWPTDAARPRQGKQVVTTSLPSAPSPSADVKRVATPTLSTPSLVSRDAWASRGPMMGDINAMQGIQRVTVHHEGWTPVTFTDARSTAARIEKIRRIHTEDRGWSDIGYHYVVDRAGRVWNARPLQYQGAHVRDQNEQNVGILVLGNFDKQAPSNVQLQSLVEVLRVIQRKFNVPKSKVYTHQELAKTACPGRALQANMAGVRSRFLA